MMRPISPEQFQQKCEAVLRPELRENKKIERFRVSRKSGKALALKLTLLVAIALPAATAQAANARDPVGKYCGELLSAGVMSGVETRFVRNAASGAITGSYVFDDRGESEEGMLAEAGDDGDGNDLTRLFIWRDRYGYGKLVVTFSADFSEFTGKWGDSGSVLAPWNGKRCSTTSS